MAKRVRLSWLASQESRQYKSCPHKRENDGDAAIGLACRVRLALRDQIALPCCEAKNGRKDQKKYSNQIADVHRKSWSPNEFTFAKGLLLAKTGRGNVEQWLPRLLDSQFHRRRRAVALPAITQNGP